jgi:hypothetical protein
VYLDWEVTNLHEMVYTQSVPCLLSQVPSPTIATPIDGRPTPAAEGMIDLHRK